MVLTEGFQDIRITVIHVIFTQSLKLRISAKKLMKKQAIIDYQLIVEKYKIFNWKEYFDIVDYLDEHDISYIVYA